MLLRVREGVSEKQSASLPKRWQVGREEDAKIVQSSETARDGEEHGTSTLNA